MSPNVPADGDGVRGKDLERSRGRLPFVILGVALLATFGVLGYTMFARAVVYYRTPTELLARPQEQNVRLSGKVVPGTIEQSVTEGTVSFVVTDGNSQVPVVYKGPAPDALKDEAEAVAEGSLGADGVFHAVNLMAKCPSKFESKTGG